MWVSKDKVSIKWDFYYANLVGAVGIAIKIYC